MWSEIPENILHAHAIVKFIKNQKVWSAVVINVPRFINWQYTCSKFITSSHHTVLKNNDILEFIERVRVRTSS